MASQGEADLPQGQHPTRLCVMVWGLWTDSHTGREAAPLQLCLALTSGKITMRDLKAEY